MATLQKLLWTKEYSDFSDEVVLVESRFVLERKHGQCMCMVHAGLTNTVVLIAEENVASNANHLRTLVVSNEAQSNVEYLHLAHLFPLENTKLSTRKHQEHRGEHVLRLRISTGKTWYLELADGRHREDRWREWLSWIHDLDNKRQEKRHGRHGVDAKKPNFNVKPSANANGYDDAKITGARQTGVACTTSEDKRCPSVTDNRRSMDGLATERHRRRRDSRAYHWVGHFGAALSRDHDGVISAAECITDTSTHPHHQSHLRLEQSLTSTSPPTDRAASLVWQQHSHAQCLALKQTEASSTDTFSSLEDIESVGSLLGDASVDWTHPESDEINRKLLLSVGDLFKKFNIESHGHGHVGRWRPMVSLTAMGQQRALVRKKLDFPNISETETLHRYSSLPDVLEGEASFLDDMHQAADAVHRQSLVYMDLVNEDDAKTPHVIGGHVMLLSPRQTELLDDIVRCRDAPQDFEFALTSESQDKVTKSTQETITSSGKGPRKNRKHSVGESLRAMLHLNKHQPATTKDRSRHLSAKILQGMRKQRELRPRRGVGGSCSHKLSTTIGDISPEALANELTLIDSCLFVNVREAELVDCLWLKDAGGTRAPHTTAFIRFFQRVVGLVSTEIVLRETARERAALLARLVEAAEWCRILQNFHSLKAILCGLKVLPVYRLKKTWRTFEEEFPVEFCTWNELACLVADDGRCQVYHKAVVKSMQCPPCLPFFGAYLWTVADHYSAVDRGGTRRKSRKDHATSSSHSSSTLVRDVGPSSAIDDDSGDLNTNRQATAPPPNGFFGAFASAWHSLRHKPHDPSTAGSSHAHSSESHEMMEAGGVGSTSGGSCGMTRERRSHVRRLVIGYAKRLAEERGMVWRAETSSTRLLTDSLPFSDGVDGSINWGNLFAKVKTEGEKPPSKAEAIELEVKRTAESALFKMLFDFQMSAVQYKHKCEPQVRSYLLRAPYNTDNQNYKVSLSREPPSD